MIQDYSGVPWKFMFKSLVTLRNFCCSSLPKFNRFRKDLNNISSTVLKAIFTTSTLFNNLPNSTVLKAFQFLSVKFITHDAATFQSFSFSYPTKDTVQLETPCISTIYHMKQISIVTTFIFSAAQEDVIICHFFFFLYVSSIKDPPHLLS